MKNDILMRDSKGAISAVVRSFIAVNIPNDVKAVLLQLQEDLKAQTSSWIRWVELSGFHLTLKFLGEVEAERLGKVERVMTGISHNNAPLKLFFRGAGCFPNLRRPRVVWVGVQGDLDPLSKLQMEMEEGLAGLGFAREGRAFIPHMTLGRVRDGVKGRDLQRLGEQISLVKWDGSAEFSVGSVELMRSDLTPKGAIYTKLASAKLEPP